MCTSAITKKKFFKLLGERYFYTVAIWCLFFFTGYEAFSVKGFLKMMFPFFTVADNFTSCFLLFYLLIPFLNKLIHALTEKEHFMLMAWCIGVYVFLPSFAKANVVFNYITWFSILYVIASYIRLYPKEWFCNVTVTGCKNRHPSPICTRFEHHFHALKPHLHRRSFSDTLPENQRHLIALKRHPLWHMQKLCQLSQPAELRSTFFRNRNAVLCQDVLQLSNPLALSLNFFFSHVKVFHRLALHLVVAGSFQF